MSRFRASLHGLCTGTTPRQRVLGHSLHYVTLSSSRGGRHDGCWLTDGETEALTCLSTPGL